MKIEGREEVRRAIEGKKGCRGGEFVREGERETDLKLLVEVGCDPDDTQCALLRENLGGIEHVRRRRAGEGGTRGGRSVSLGEGAGGAAKIKVATWRERSGTSDNVQGYESPPSIGVAVTVFGCGGSWEDVRGTSGVPLPVPCPGDGRPSHLLRGLATGDVEILHHTRR